MVFLCELRQTVFFAIFTTINRTTEYINLIPPSSDSVTFTKTATPGWLLAFWKEIDDKTWGKGFDCFTEHAEGTLGVGHWQGREAIRANLRAFVDKQTTTHHDVVEYWDGGRLKVFRGFVTMKGRAKAGDDALFLYGRS
jgi:hypothetical protein